jgi:predicted Zn-dependent protease
VSDGSIDDARVLPYLQQLTDRLSGRRVSVRLLRTPKQYAAISAKGGVDLSAGMMGRIEDEAELAGLIAHELAHLTLSRCALDPQAPPPTPDSRGVERQATILAITTLKTAGYDPTSLLSLLSKLAYEHPVWGKAIDSDDLLELRAKLENEPLPPAGLRLDSSGFVHAHAVVLGMLPKARD